MHDLHHSKADLHVHSKHSDRPSEWFLRRIGAPESFVEPAEIYRRARQRGMDFVTISDHNCIRGALEIADLPGVFLSNEVTTYFPEDGCKIHVLVFGIDEEQFRAIQELRSDIRRLHRYLVDEEVLSAVAHPMYRVNGRLTIDHLEQLLLMFGRFEEINGARDQRGAELVRAIFRNLTPEIIARMADRHGMEPTGPEPWRKVFVGGSDDHSGAHVGSAHTTTPYAADVEEFLAHLRHGDHEAAGFSGGSVLMGHSLYHIAYGYYESRFIRGNGKPTILGELFKHLLETPVPQGPASMGQKLRGLAGGIVRGRHLSKLNDTERTLVNDFARLFSAKDERDAASPLTESRRTFHIAGQISHALGYTFFQRFLEFMRQGKLIESLQTVASLGPVVLGMAPYLAAFSTQHKDAAFHDAVAAHFATMMSLPKVARRTAWLTDTYTEINGVSRTIQSLGAAARRTGKRLTVLTCLEDFPATEADVKNFAPVGTFPMPEYETQRISFPPFLDVIEYIERNRFTDLIISTPGPMGLTALAAARLLGLRTVGIYHTDFVQYVRYLTQDDDMAEMTWKYMLWFYDQVDIILAPTEYYRRYLMDHNFAPAKLKVMARGVDTRQFQPKHRDPAYYDRFGLSDSFKFLYVGRISREKNLDRLIGAFDRLRQHGHDASLVLVGDGPYRKELQARLDGRPIAFTGLLEGENLAAAYASADCMVFPSCTDTFGNVVLEAQASGLPVIVTDRGGPAEIVHSHESGIVVDHADGQAMLDAMELLLLSPEVREDLRSRGLRNAAECGWEQVLQSLWSLGQANLVEAEISAYRSPDGITAPGLISMELS